MTEIASRCGGGNSRRRARPHPTDNAAIYDGRHYLGIVLPHGNTAWRAVDVDDRLIGVFTDRREAAIAIMRGVP